MRLDAAERWEAAGEEGSHRCLDRNLDLMGNRKRLSIVKHLIGWFFEKHLFDTKEETA